MKNNSYSIKLFRFFLGLLLCLPAAYFVTEGEYVFGGTFFIVSLAFVVDWSKVLGSRQ